MTNTVPEIWPGATVVILAGGPSLRTQELVDDEQVKLISINDSWRLLPSWEIAMSKPCKCQQCNGTGGAPNEFCSMCHGVGKLSACAMYFCDPTWWRNSIAANARSCNNTYSFHEVIYKGWWWTGAPGFEEHPQVNALRLTGQTGLEDKPTGLRHGSNSGYQAINLAVHFGAKNIILLGYDMKMEGGRNNWHDVSRPLASPALYEQTMLPHFKSLVEPLRERAVNVINCTPDSALDTFPKAKLRDVLYALRASENMKDPYGLSS